MFTLKKTILLLWSLTLLAVPLTTFAEEVKEAVEKVDINTADMDTLADKLYGVGPVKAEAIVKYREEHGPFKAVIELIQVHGIGEGTLESNKDILTVSVPQEEATKETTNHQTSESTSDKVEKVEEETAIEQTTKEEATSEKEKPSTEKKPEPEKENVSDEKAKTE